MALPRTLGELQLYRVLQRANLLSYYETFIQQGGDDVQQLCEAGEEEFLEIMALVGMATKPLHVRRLQKALREWATNPGLFSQPVPAVPVSSIPLFKISETAGTRKGSMSNGHGSPGEKAGSARSFSPKSPLELGEKLSPVPGGPGAGDARIWPGRSTPESDVGAGGEEEAGSPPFSPPAGGGVPEGTGAGGLAAPGAGGAPDRLEPEMVRMVVESVERIFRSFPRGDAGEVTSLLKLNKKLARSVGHIFEMDDNDSQKEEEIRKYSIIYGRFDSKRREGKQLSLHEVRTPSPKIALGSQASTCSPLGILTFLKSVSLPFDQDSRPGFPLLHPNSSSCSASLLNGGGNRGTGESPAVQLHAARVPTGVEEALGIPRNLWVLTSVFFPQETLG